MTLILVLTLFSQVAPDSHASVAQAFALMNQARARHGLQPYRPNVALARAAETQARNQARRGRMGHDGGGGPFARMRQAGYAGRSGGENVAMGQRSAEEVVGDWLKSPGHRAAILSRTYVDAGIACEMGSRGPFWCSTFGGP